MQKLNNKQSAKVILGMIDLEHMQRQKSHMCIEKLLTAHAFHYIVLRVNPGLTSCEDLTMDGCIGS